MPVKSPTKDKKSDVADTAIGVSRTVLIALQAAASVAPVPYLQQAATSALNILACVQGAKANQDGFADLASDACEVVYTIDSFVKGKEGRQLPVDLTINLETLLAQLQEIEMFATKKRGFVKRFVLASTDVGKIAQYRSKLTQIMATFGLESNLHIRDGLAQIAKRQELIFDILNQKSLEPVPALTNQPPRHGILSNSNVNAANSNFTIVSGDQSNSSVNNHITNTNSGNVSTISYMGYGGGRSTPRRHING